MVPAGRDLERKQKDGRGKAKYGEMLKKKEQNNTTPKGG